MLGRILNKIKYPINFVKNKFFYNQFIGNNKIFFDIGANIGFKTRIFRSLGMSVVVVEPQDSCFSILEKKYSKDKDVFLVKKGLGSKTEDLKIKIDPNNTTIATFSDKWQKDGRFNNFNYTEEQAVQMITFDDLISTYGIPDFAKIDVEGYEFEVIKGLTQKIPCLSFEFTSEFFNDSINIIEYLNKLGFEKFNYVQGEEMKLKFQNWIDKDALISFINKQIYTNHDLWGDIYAS